MKNIKSLKKLLVLSLAVILAFSIFTGCGKKGATNNAEFDTKASKYGSTYPIEGAEDVTLTYWRQTTAAVQKSAPTNYGELPFAKELEKQTGVKVEYIHPSLTNAAEKFTLMIASGNLPDIIGWNMNSYTGGSKAAISDGVILPLNEEGNNMLEAWAPDYYSLLEKYPDSVAKEAKTDNGHYFAFGTIAPDRELNTTAGPIVRGDWLEDLGLEIPKTVDDWYVMLKAFKEKKGATAPLSMSSQGFYCGFITGAYGINNDYYHDDNVVKFGPAEAGYKEYLTTMNKWYKEGLFDSSFDTIAGTDINAKLLNGKAGATWNALGGGIGTLSSNVEAKTADDPNKDAIFIGAPYPTLDGSKSEFGQSSQRFNPVASISSQCKDPELAIKWLNYGYTEKGHMLFNFGIEGVSYEWVETEHRATDEFGGYIKNEDGSYKMETSKYPKYTEEITANPTLTMQEAFAKYAQAGGAGGGGQYRQDPRYLEQYAMRPQQHAAWEVWCDTNVFNHYVPNTGVADEYAQEYSKLYVDITAYVQQEYIKFVKGTRPISEFDSYIQTLKDMGLDKMIQMKQEAFDAYNAR